MNEEKNMSNFSKRRLKHGVGGIAVTAAVIAIVIIINVLVSRLPADISRIDTSGKDYYSISETTKNITSNLGLDVTMYHICARGNEDARISELLRRYSELSQRITVKNIDPQENPGFVSEYTEDTLADNSVIAVSDLRSYVINSDKILYRQFANYEEYYYYSMGYDAGEEYFAGELTFTSAIDYVSREKLPVLYALSGHGETELDDGYSSALENDNIPFKSLRLLAEESVPEDCGAVLINSPQSDITDDELEKLSGYFEEGGNILLITEFNKYTSETMPNIASLCSAAGLSSREELVTDEERCFQYPYALLPELTRSNDNPVSLLADADIYVLASFSHCIVAAEDSSSEFSGILKTTDKARLMNVDEDGRMTETDDDSTGAYYVGAMTNTEANGTRGDSSKFIWYSSPSITDAQYNYYTGGGNLNLFSASAGLLCEKQESVSVLAKSMSNATMIIDEQTGNLWWIAMTIAVPALILGGGMFVWIRRRRR